MPAQPSASGWGTAMSTDTAFALGMLALVGKDVPDRVRTYLLTFAIVDDVVGIVIIALVTAATSTRSRWASGWSCSRWSFWCARAAPGGAVYLVLGVAPGSRS